MSASPTPVAAPSNFRYLKVVGATNAWIVPAFVLFAAAMVYWRLNDERPSISTYLFFFMVPIAVGTGLLTAGRRGELDLLFGAGQTRAAVWRSAFIRAWCVPMVLAMALLLLAGPPDPKSTLLSSAIRLVPVLLFTGGIGFALGLVEPRFLVGVLWLVLRMIFIMTPPGLSLVTRLSKGVDVPTAGGLSFLVLAAPETLLEPYMPLWLVFLSGVVGLAAIAASYVWFQRADFGGKRH